MILKSVGLALIPREIASILAFMGVLTVIYQLGVYPLLSRSFDAVTLYRCSIPIYFLIWIALPILTMFWPVESLQTLTWIFLIATLALRRFANVVAFTSINIIISNAAPQSKLGIVNGLGVMCASFLKSVGPILAGSLWSFSVYPDRVFPFNQSLVFAVLFLTTFFTASQSFFLK